MDRESQYSMWDPPKVGKRTLLSRLLDVDLEHGWKSADGLCFNLRKWETIRTGFGTLGREREMELGWEEDRPSTSASHMWEELDQEEATLAHEADKMSEIDGDKAYDFEDLEMLTAEIGNLRNGLRLMPDFQRREMAAMFGDSGGGEEDLIDESEKIA